MKTIWIKVLFGQVFLKLLEALLYPAVLEICVQHSQ